MCKKLVFEILEDLIRINTSNPPGNEKTAVEYLYRLFLKYGITMKIQDLGNNRANLIASYGGDGPEIIFCGHLDVVPAGEMWTMNPFEAECKDGRIYGRGAADMKGGIAAMCAAMIRLAEEKVILQGKLTLVFVADEEFCNLGMRRFLKDKKEASLAVIGEPTELQVAIAHRGVLRDYIDIIAPSYHAALPGRKYNAVNYAAEAMIAIFQLNEKLKCYHHEILPAPSIAITKVEGYECDNIVPGSVRLLTDFRILPEMNFEECREIEETALSNIEEYEIKQHFFMPGGEIDKQHKFVKLCCEIGEKIFKKKQEPIAFDASCEQCFLLEQGIPTVVCGPGSLKQAHVSDEYVEVEQILLAEQFYYKLAKDFCRGRQDK